MAQKSDLTGRLTVGTELPLVTIATTVMRTKTCIGTRSRTSRRLMPFLFGRVTYEMMEAAWRQPRTGPRPDWMEPFARTSRLELGSGAVAMRYDRPASKDHANV